MCTVTFWPRRRGFLLGMNRDEQRTRISGLPPERFAVGARRGVNPREPGGGTWISVNDLGIGFALLNWYAVAAVAAAPAVSRGGIVLAVRDADSSAEVVRRLGRLPWPRLNPCRLLGIFPGERQVREWRWDLHGLTVVTHPWQPAQWQSSGHREAEAQRIRGAEFQRRRADADAGSVGWLRRLHASHAPASGAFSVCMHRDDAATVSYTELEVTPQIQAVRHRLGAPCEAGPFHDLSTAAG